MRIITLSPHLTEIVFALGAEDQVVAVSDYSDFPEQASSLPSVANFQGVNIAAILRLKPTHILAWEGGNKQSDLVKLAAMGFDVYASAPKHVEDLTANISKIGAYIDRPKEASELVAQINQSLKQIATIADEQDTLKAAYVMNLHPLSGAGNDVWLNSILEKCRLRNIYANETSSYIQLSIADLLRQSPSVIVSVDSDIKNVLLKHQAVFKPKTVMVNADALHRFTPRVIPEIRKLCLSRQDF